MQITTYYTPYIALLAILLFLTAANCKKDDDTNPIDQLPPITTEGKGTFACLINGEVWKWKGRNPWNGFPNLDTSYGPTNILRIQAKRKDDNVNQTLTIHEVVSDTGKYILDFDRTNILRNWNHEIVDCIGYDLDTMRSNFLRIIKLDIKTKIISGTFEFTIFNDCDTLRITEGRFDDFYRE